MSAPQPLAAVMAPAAALPEQLTAELDELEAVSRDLELHTHAANTQRAYSSAWRHFAQFCDEHQLTALPAHPESVRWWVAWMSTQRDEHDLPRFAVTTIRQRLAGVADKHLSQGLLDPTTHRGVTDLVRGLSKMRATRPRRKLPLLRDDVVKVIATMEHGVHPAGISATRDTLVLWLGFATALRRSEVAALGMRSVRLDAGDGVHVRVGRSKTDQTNTAPDVVVLPYGGSPLTCGPCALHRWVKLVNLWEQTGATARRPAMMRQLFEHQWDRHVCGHHGGPGLISSADLMSGTPLLRATYRNQRAGSIHERGVSGDALHQMLLSRLANAGFDPTGYGFHSLRAGFVTQARRNGADPSDVRRQTRHASDTMVETYDREWMPIRRNAVTQLGL